MEADEYIVLKEKLIQKGYADEINWAENLKVCNDSESFCLEYIWVVCNSGMKNQIAEKIYRRILKAISDTQDISSVFGHKGKVSGIKKVMQNHKEIFADYLIAKDKTAFCESLPWIGKITKYHLAKNLGEDIAKPDRHLMRIAKEYNMSPFELCKTLSDLVGDRIRTVDVILWRAANLGLV